MATWHLHQGYPAPADSLQNFLAAGLLGAGDTIQLDSGYSVDEAAGVGVSWVDDVTLEGATGDAADAICTFSNSGAATNVSAIYIGNVSGWTIRNITVRYTGAETDDCGCIDIQTSADTMTLEDLILETTANGVRYYGEDATLKRISAISTGTVSGPTDSYGLHESTDDGAVIESCLVVNFGYIGIMADRNATLKNCTVYNDRSDANNSSSVTGIHIDAYGDIDNCVVFMNCTKAGARGIRLENGYDVTINDTISYGTATGDAKDLSYGGSAPTLTNVSLSSTVLASPVLEDPASGDFYPADPGLALQTGNAANAPAGGDLNELPFDTPPSMGCLEAVAGGGGTTRAVGNSRAGFLSSPFTLTP